MSIKKAGNALLNLLFPPRCIWCGEVQGMENTCGCVAKMKMQALPTGALQLTQNNQLNTFVPTVWACYWYETPVSDAILRFKFEDEPEAALVFGKLLAERFVKEPIADQFDCFVPVPSSAKTLRERGYSQTLLLAKQLAKTTGLPLVDKALIKTTETQRQAMLTRSERLTNIVGVYGIKAGSLIFGKRICLVDDIITTGSTLNECGRVLLEAGAASCGAICIASTRKEQSTGSL